MSGGVPLNSEIYLYTFSTLRNFQYITGKCNKGNPLAIHGLCAGFNILGWNLFGIPTNCSLHLKLWKAKNNVF